MSGASKLETILRDAKEKEKVYDWLGVAESYKKALDMVPDQDFASMAEICERTAQAFCRAAFQAEKANDFQEMMQQGILRFEKANELCAKLNDSSWTSKMLRGDAMIAYMGYWLAPSIAEKKKLLDECWNKGKEALRTLDEANDAREYVATYNKLSSCAYLKYVYEWSFETRKKTIEEAIEYGKHAITLLPSVDDVREIAGAYLNTALYLTLFGTAMIPDLDEKERHCQQGLGYWQKANEVSEEATLLGLLSISGEGLDWNIEEVLEHYEKALGYARQTGDKYLIGTALDMLAYASLWQDVGTEDQDKRVELIQRALQLAEEAKRQFSSISFSSPRAGILWTGAPYAEYYCELAQWEVQAEKRRSLLEKAEKYGIKAVELAESTGYPDIIGGAHHVLSKALGTLAQTETTPEEKERLLERALEHRKESVRLTEQLQPFFYINRGVMWNYLADIKAELSSLETDPQSKRKLLEEAVSDKERCLQLCVKENSYREKMGNLSYFPTLGRFQYSCGALLDSLYELSGSNEHQRRATRAFEEAAISFQKLDLNSRVAECNWKVAKIRDALGEHLKAAENFNVASENYRIAAEKIPQLKGFYRNYASYMEAWSEIEEARYHHQRQEYGAGEDHFDKAAKLHKSLRQWSYLAENYAAWAQVEHAEELSRRERSEEAQQAFEDAIGLFKETEKSIQTQLHKILNPDEKQMATSIFKATDLRGQYCRARIAVEEAKILDKKGDHAYSSDKYGSAVEVFQKIAGALESGQERKEFELIITLSQAWQKMTRAEAEESHSLFIEASQLFEEAKELSHSEKAKMLALGHSRFCRALEAGTRFADTREPALHDIAIRHLESAATYYVKAGFQNASEYARATELLFDAYMQADKARRESDPEKRAKLYTMTEKILQTSADSFMKAEYLEKREQVLRLLEKIRGERDLAISLTEVLHAPSVVSATTAFSSPTPTHESAVGLRSFETANIQVSVIAHQESLCVGENLHLEVDIVNAGNSAATLINLADVVPEGFELIEKPESYRVEDGYINMKGKRLDPLKTEEVILILRPKIQGTFALRPTISYMDENGSCKSGEPEPISLKVKELGIKGWLKGER